MKKAIAFLMVFALIGAVVFAQDAAAPAPVANGLVDILTTAPVVTYGIDGGIDYVALTPSPQGDVIAAADGTLSYRDPLQMNAFYFFTTPWVTAAYKNLSFTNKFYYDPQNYDNVTYAGSVSGFGGAAPQLIESAISYKFDKLTLGSTTFVDPLNTAVFYNRSNIAASTDNVDATFAVANTFANDFTQFGLSGAFLITDASFTMKNMFDVLTVKLGGSGSNYLRIRGIEYATPFYPYFVTATTNGRIRIRDTAAMFGLADVITMSAAELPMIMTVDMNKKNIPLTIYGSFDTPLAATNLNDWLAGQNMLLAAKYDLKDIGSFDFGYIAGIGYNKNLTEAAGIYTTGTRVVNNNTIYLDAKITAVAGLTALVGMDLNMTETTDVDATIAGAGTLASPYVAAYIPSTKWNFGFEANYDMDAMVKGLVIDAGMYMLGGSGKTYENQTVGTGTFAADTTAAYPAATFFVMPSYTADAYNQQTYYAGNPFKGFLKASYGLNDTFSFWLKDIYTAKAGSLTAASTTYASAVKKPIGYYDSNKIQLGTDITQGSATISVTFGFTSLLGLPSATDMGYVASTTAGTIATIENQAFAEAPTTVRFPWDLNIVYSISF